MQFSARLNKLIALQKSTGLKMKERGLNFFMNKEEKVSFKKQERRS
jgi:hypothetical protein